MRTRRKGSTRRPENAPFSSHLLPEPTTNSVLAVCGEIFQYHQQTRKGGWGAEKQKVHNWHTFCQLQGLSYLHSGNMFQIRTDYFHHTNRCICPLHRLPYLSGYVRMSALQLPQLRGLSSSLPIDVSPTAMPAGAPRQDNSRCFPVPQMS